MLRTTARPPSPAALRAFIRRHTVVRPVPDFPGVRLHQGDDVMELCSLAGIELGQPDPPLPYWAFPWSGGLAVARYLLEHPGEVAGRSVLDLATGSGLCAIVAMRLGARSARGVDIDPLAAAAADLNARENGVRVDVIRRDVLDDPPPPSVEVVLAGDVCYEETMATRVVDWLRHAAGQGSRVLLGDPGRTYLPRDLELVASYRVRTTRELEANETRESFVYVVPRA